MRRDQVLKIVTVIELLLAALFVILDVLIPTIVILALMTISMLLRREKLSDIGFKKLERPFRLILSVFALSVIWTIIDFSLVLPVLNHLTGAHQDLSTFENLKGNIGQLIFLLAAGWTLAALGEEIVYRGYLQNRIRALFDDKKIGVFLGICATSVLFGFAHTEQGLIGVVVTFVDAVFFSLLRRRYKNNMWAPVLGHGFNNTIGILTFFFIGPLYGLW